MTVTRPILDRSRAATWFRTLRRVTPDSARLGEGPSIALLTDLWPSRSTPMTGSFVYAETEALGARFRHVVLTPRLLAPQLHRRIWSSGVQGWPHGWTPPRPPARLIRYPMVRIPKAGEVRARVLGARAALGLARERPQLVHAHFLLNTAAAGVRLARAFEVPCVLRAHGTDVRFLVEGRVQERHRGAVLHACSDADRVVVVAAFMREQLVALGVPRERVVVIPMGADFATFAPRNRDEARAALGLPDDARIVLFVGHAQVEKGVAVLDAAVRSLQSELRGLQAYAAGQPGLEVPGLTALGVLPAEGLALWLNAADVMCLPSFAEGSPVSVVEALACGTPVVATRVGGIPELIEDAANGFLVEPGDLPALRDALRAALAFDWQRERIRAGAAGFSLAATAGAVATLYEELLAASRRGRNGSAERVTM
jgi:teichuronic acid biosynthesis glycosyltransferase TuaC